MNHPTLNVGATQAQLLGRRVNLQRSNSLDAMSAVKANPIMGPAEPHLVRLTLPGQIPDWTRIGGAVFADLPGLVVQEVAAPSQQLPDNWCTEPSVGDVLDVAIRLSLINRRTLVAALTPTLVGQGNCLGPDIRICVWYTEGPLKGVPRSIRDFESHLTALQKRYASKPYGYDPLVFSFDFGHLRRVSNSSSELLDVRELNVLATSQELSAFHLRNGTSGESPPRPGTCSYSEYELVYNQYLSCKCEYFALADQLGLCQVAFQANTTKCYSNIGGASGISEQRF
jgi:hypothetical protein